jgi:hypothetical protein
VLGGKPGQFVLGKTGTGVSVLAVTVVYGKHGVLVRAGKIQANG